MPLHSDSLVRPLWGVKLGLEVGSGTNNTPPRETPFASANSIGLIGNKTSPSQQPSELSGSVLSLVRLNKACKLELVALRRNEVFKLRRCESDVREERAEAATRQSTRSVADGSASRKMAEGRDAIASRKFADEIVRGKMARGRDATASRSVADETVRGTRTTGQDATASTRREGHRKVVGGQLINHRRWTPPIAGRWLRVKFFMRNVGPRYTPESRVG